MITFALNVVYSFLSWLISVFPVGTGFPDGIHSAFSTLGGYFHILDPLVPISTLLTCVLLVFGVEIALFAFRTLKWILSYIPFIGGSSGN